MKLGEKKYQNTKKRQFEKYNICSAVPLSGVEMTEKVTFQTTYSNLHSIKAIIITIFLIKIYLGFTNMCSLTSVKTKNP
ncbi:hypothetical protein GCM10022258_31450 [Aquimarina gracilis]